MGKEYVVKNKTMNKITSFRALRLQEAYEKFFGEEGLLQEFGYPTPDNYSIRELADDLLSEKDTKKFNRLIDKLSDGIISELNQYYKR